MSAQEYILTISIAAKLIHLHPRTLMLYEQAGVFQPHRTDTKRRLYSKKDLEQLQFIKHLTQAKGINLQGVKYILEAIAIAEKEGLDLKSALFPAFKTETLF